MTRWIPCSERLPTHPYSVLGWVTKGGLVIPDERGMRDIVTYFPKTGRWHQPIDGGDAHVEVSHWMDLPPPPGGWQPGASSDDEDRPLPEDPPAPVSVARKAVIKKCRGGRTEHLMEPEWEGRSYAFMKCRWCGKREAV